MRAKLFGERGHFFRLMAHDDENLRGLQRLAGTYDGLKERASSGAVQNLGEVGAQARPFSGGQNYDGSVGGRHEREHCRSARTLSQ